MKKTGFFAAGLLVLGLILAACGSTGGAAARQKPADAAEQKPADAVNQSRIKLWGETIQQMIERGMPAEEIESYLQKWLAENSLTQAEYQQLKAKAQEWAERQAKAEAEKQAKAEAEKQAKEEAARKAEEERQAAAEERARLVPQWNAEDFGQGAAVAQTFDAANAEQWDTALKAIDAGGNEKNYVINVSGNFSGGISFARIHRKVAVSLRSGGPDKNAITRSSFTIADGETLILRDIDLEGVKVNVAEGGTLVLEKGEIGGFSYGGGGKGDDSYEVNGRVNVAGTFIMKGGSVIGNNAGNYYEDHDGRAAVEVTGTFTMKGGTISGNTNSNYHGGAAGVFVAGSGTFNMEGGTISDNTASSESDRISKSGGVYTAGTFTMSGGSISGNSTKAGGSNSSCSGGGGVYVAERGTFTMSGGEISGNSANYGEDYTSTGVGGVYVAERGTFAMSNGKISGNSANYRSTDGRDGTYTSGGVYVGGTFSMSGGDIGGNSGNSSDGVGGVWVAEKGTFAMSGGTIHGSDAGDQANKGKIAALFGGNRSGAKYGNGSLILEGYRVNYIDDTITGKK